MPAAVSGVTVAVYDTSSVSMTDCDADRAEEDFEEFDQLIKSNSRNENNTGNKLFNGQTIIIGILIIIIMLLTTGQFFMDQLEPIKNKFNIVSALGGVGSVSVDALGGAGGDKNNRASDHRGFIAIQYSGTVRSFTQSFHSQLINLIASSPYTVHIFMHAAMGRADWKTTAHEHEHVEIFKSFNATLKYWDGYYNIDNEWVSLLDDCLKFTLIDDDNQMDMEPSARFNYTRILEIIGNRYERNSKPRSIMGALDSHRKVNEARVKYEKQHGIDYTWVVRLRMDHVMKSNVWEDLFNIEPIDLEKNENHQKLYLEQQQEANSANSANAWNGGILHDQVWTPAQGVNISSPDHANSMYVPTNDWWEGIMDQFAIGGRQALTFYHERFNIELISDLIKRGDWQLWAEPLVAQAVGYYGIKVHKIRHVYNILRVILTPEKAKVESNFLASRCVWIWYAKDSMKEHCPHWINLQQTRNNQIITLSNDTANQQLINEPYANIGQHAQQSLTNYLTNINNQRLNFLSGFPSLSLNLPRLALTEKSSNYFYFWRYRSIKQLVPCGQPEHSVYPEIAGGPEAHQGSEHPPFDLYHYFYYPFLQISINREVQQKFRQHQVCVHE